MTNAIRETFHTTPGQIIQKPSKRIEHLLDVYYIVDGKAHLMRHSVKRKSAIDGRPTTFKQMNGEIHLAKPAAPNSQIKIYYVPRED